MISINFKNAFSKIKRDEFKAQSQYLERYWNQFESRNQGFYKILDDERILDQIEDFYKNLDSSFENFVILGIGGSGLAFKSIINAFPSKTNKKFFVLDNVDPTKIARIEGQLNLKKTLFLVITKSGKTPETISQFFYFRDKILNNKLDQKKHFVFISDSGSFLHKLATKEKINFFEIPSNVGGRFSVLTAVGLLPAKILGLNVQNFIKGAMQVRTRFLSKDFEKNIPFQLAALQALHYEKNIKQNVFFPYSEKLKRVGEWFVQLLAESTGKINKQNKSVGITPICVLGARDQHSILQLFSEGENDKFFIFLKILNFEKNLQIPQITKMPVDLDTDSIFGFLRNRTFGELLNAEFEGTCGALTEKGCPNITIEIPKINEENLGALFFLFESSTAFLGEFLAIDAFNQPGVERSKILTKKILENL